MPRSDALAAEVAAMARIESAYQALDNLSDKARRRVRQWAAEAYPEPSTVDLAKQLRQLASSDQGATNEFVSAALALADAVDGGNQE